MPIKSTQRIKRSREILAIIYLHCDPTASHYLKIVMDAVFGPENFRTEIVWKRSSAHSDAKQGRTQHGRIHDIILFYTKTNQWTWNQVYMPYDDSYINTFYKHIEPESGRRYQLDNLAGPGGAAKGNPSYEVMGVTRYWRYTQKKMARLIRDGRVVQTRPGAVPRYKRYLDEMPGAPIQDIWTDIGPISSQAAERLGYPTQKPEALLERIIRASSNEGDIVLDPFCGCGTAIAVSQKLNRQWIGIDITHLAISLIKNRLRDTFGEETQYKVIGVPEDLKGAEALKNYSPMEFQQWALGLVDARPASDKGGADRGIDGCIYFHDDPKSTKTKSIIIQVKSGHVGPAQIRDLKGVIDREKAQIGVFISLAEPTRAMKTEAVETGYYDSPLGHKYPRLQILTIKQLLAGKKIDYPSGVRGRDATFKKAPKHSKKDGEQEKMFD